MLREKLNTFLVVYLLLLLHDYLFILDFHPSPVVEP